MGINKSVYIRHSVGNRGVNEALDVKQIQSQLNDQMPRGRMRLAVDGRAGAETIDAIREFQKNVLNYSNPDGRVDPNSKTLQALNDPQSQAKWSRATTSSVSSDENRAMTELLACWNYSGSSSKGPQDGGQKLEAMRTELRRLEEIVKRKYPRGRPTGLGVLAVYAPGDATLRNVRLLANKIKTIQREHGTGWATVTVIVSPPVVPFLVYEGILEDTVSTIVDFVTGNFSAHEHPRRYDLITKRIRELRQKIEQH